MTTAISFLELMNTTILLITKMKAADVKSNTDINFDNHNTTLNTTLNP